MQDIIFVISFKKLKKNRILVVTCYSCLNKYNVKGEYKGGIILEQDLRQAGTALNIGASIKNKLIEGFQIYSLAYTQSEFIFTIESFYQFYNKLNLSDYDFFYVDNKDNRLVQFKGISFVSNVNEKFDVIDLIDGFIQFYGKEIKIIKKSVSPKLFKQKCCPILIEQNNSVFQLVFEYGIVDFDYFDTKIGYFTEKTYVVRNKVEERDYFSVLLSRGFTVSKDKKLIYSTVFDPKKFKEFDIRRDVSPSDSPSSLDVVIKDNGTDWLDVSIVGKINGKVVDLTDLIDLYSMKNNISYNGYNLNIPQELLELKSEFERKGKRIVLDRSKIWIDWYLNSKNRTKMVKYSDLPIKLNDKVKRIIKPYQIQGVKWLYWLYLYKLGGCLADDMGLGKTLQVISFLSEEKIYNSLKRVLIVVPKSLIANWLREFERFGKPFVILVYHGPDRNQKMHGTNWKIMLTTYQTVANEIDEIKKFKFDIAVFDEIQTIKNDSTLQYNKLMLVDSSIRIGMSGTPMENNVEELWNILNFLNPKLFLTKRKFISLCKINPEKIQRTIAPFLLRRMKKDVIGELPKKQEEVVFCMLSDHQSILYEAIRQSAINELRSARIYNSIILKSILYLRECCDSPAILPEGVNPKRFSYSGKIEYLDVLINNLVLNKHKVVVFSQFVQMLKILYQRYNIQYEAYYVDGNTSNRQSVIDEFESNQQGILFISLKVGGVGLNLTSAQDVVLFEPWWNPFVEEQASDRVYRIGQRNDVCIYKLITVNTIEEKILNLQDSKRDVFKYFVENKNTATMIEAMKYLLDSE